MVECMSTAVSIFAPWCCSGYASQQVSQCVACGSPLHRKPIIPRSVRHFSGASSGVSGRPSKVLMYTSGSLVMVGSKTMWSMSTVRRCGLFSHRP
ncbi:hypothetical protein D3C78_1007750 [compost metagenome]